MDIYRLLNTDVYRTSKYSALISAFIQMSFIFPMFYWIRIPVNSLFSSYSDVFIEFIGVVLAIFILAGYLKISKEYQNNFLKFMVKLSIVIVIITFLLLILARFIGGLLFWFLIFGNNYLSAFVFVLFGISILTLKNFENKNNLIVGSLYILWAVLEASWESIAIGFVYHLFWPTLILVVIRIGEFILFFQLWKSSTGFSRNNLEKA